MGSRRLIASGWFWAVLGLLAVTLGVFGYTWYLRRAVDDLMREQVQARRRFVDFLEGLRDEKDLEAAWAKVREHLEHARDLAERARQLPQPSAQLQKELSQRYGPELRAVVNDYGKQVQRIEQIPGGKDFCAKFVASLPPAGLSFILEGSVP